MPTMYATAAEWAGLNLFVPANTIGEESDTGKRKSGGTAGNYWNSLSYTSTASGSYNFDTVPSGSAVATAATATTLAVRDSNANLSADGFIPSSTSTATAAGTTTLTVDSTELQFFTGTSTQTVLLPTTGVPVGRLFVIFNTSTGLVTVQSSGANTIGYAPASGGILVVQANTATPTTAAHWTVRSYAATTSYTSGVISVALRDNNNILFARALIAASTTTATAAGTTTLTISSPTIQIFTGSTTQTITLPTTTVILGHRITFINKSSGALTVNSSGGNLVATVAGGATAEVMANQSTPTTAAHWSVLSNGGTA